MDIKETKEIISSGKPIIDYDNNSLKYVQKPLGKALYRGRPRKNEEDKGKPTDKIKCSLCGNSFTRSNRSHHNKTQRHLLYDKVNKKMAKLVIDD